MREERLREREREALKNEKMVMILALYKYTLYLTWWEIDTVDSPSLKTETQCTHGLI